MKDKFVSPGAFAWRTQLRYYLHEVGTFVRVELQKQDTKMERTVCNVHSTLLNGFGRIGITERRSSHS